MSWDAARVEEAAGRTSRKPFAKAEAPSALSVLAMQSTDPVYMPGLPMILLLTTSMGVLMALLTSPDMKLAIVWTAMPSFRSVFLNIIRFDSSYVDNSPMLTMRAR